MYTSESFWNADTISAAGNFLLLLVAFCLPAIAAFRGKNKKIGIISVILGITGCFFYIPWFAACGIVPGKVKFCEKKDGKVPPVFGMILCLLFAVVWIFVVVIGIGIRSKTQDNFTYGFQESFIVYNNIVYGVILLVFTAAALIMLCRDGKGYWSGQLFFSGYCTLILGAGKTFLSTSVISMGWMVIAVEILAFAGVTAGFYNVITAVVPNGTENQKISANKPATGRVFCFLGQYKGAEFRLEDGETICFGSSPQLSHLVFENSGLAPLHAELVYQKKDGIYRISHQEKCSVYINGKIAPERCNAAPGARITFGNPIQGIELR